MVNLSLVESVARLCHLRGQRGSLFSESRNVRPIRSAVLMVALLLTGCTLPGKKPVPQPVAVAAPPTRADIWQAQASLADTNRIRRVATGWSSGLAEARAGGF